MSELHDLKRISEIDGLIDAVRSWTENDVPWRPVQQDARFLQAVLTRADRIRGRLQLPLVVATFGGSGTGKSSLVNALVGTEVSRSGKMRPTTTRPVVVAAPETELEPLGLPLDELEISRASTPFLSEIVLIDCPDPDTSGDAEGITNLTRLRQLLPHCDVLLYTSTQQKYKSASVVDELVEAATGCRLLFVQTHADRDSDIRDDWREELESKFHVPELFLIDTRAALESRVAGEMPAGEFARLLNTLQTQLGRSERLRIRQSNLLDLLTEAVQDSASDLNEKSNAVTELTAALQREQLSLTETLTEQLIDELMLSRHLWERRLLGRVTEVWGASPFSTCLRLYNGVGTLIASSSLLRARSSAQIAIIGALEGARRLRSRSQEVLADERLDRLGRFGLDDTAIRQSRLVIAGFSAEAEFDSGLLQQSNLNDLRDQAARVEDSFLGNARTRIEEIITDLARRHTGWFTRLRYEVFFLAYLLFVLYRVGRNFFYDSFLAKYFGADNATEPLLTLDFYIPAGIFFLVWSGVLVLMYTRRLHRGLKSEITSMAEALSQRQLSAGLFPELQSAAENASHAVADLNSLSDRLTEFQARSKSPSQLGAKIQQD